MQSNKTEGPNLKTCDCIIIGGGPAGCATAISLRAHAPSLDIILVESSCYDKPRIGEVLPAVAREFLAQIGVLEAFEAEGFRPAHSTKSVWGIPHRSENHFIYSLHGAGWHLDRARFDSFMAEQAACHGVEVLMSTQFTEINHSEDGWAITLSDGTRIRSRFVVDATGRRAAFARKMGARLIASDRLAGFARFFTLEANSEPATLIEAFPEGWWYTAPTGNRRVVACMTDTDIAQKLTLRDQNRWLGLLSKTDWISRSIGRGTLHGDAINCAANSVRLEPVCSTDWLAVGDAASAFDPLSSQGIVKSLRAGVFASYAIADRLNKHDLSGLNRYENFVQREFSSYQRAHAQFCGEERRWPESRFWQRRHIA